MNSQEILDQTNLSRDYQNQVYALVSDDDPLMITYNSLVEIPLQNCFHSNI